MSESLGKPSVSVIIPIFNGSEYVIDVFTTLNGQIYKDFEAIFVDDGSSDDTLNKIEKNIVKFKSINARVVQSSHKGLPATRNIGILNSVGNYLAFLDCDDSWEPNKLQSQIEYINKSDCVAVFSRVNLVTGDGSVAPSKHNLKQFVDAPLELITREFVIYGGGSNILCERKIIDQIGLFDETLAFAEDFDFWLRISTLGKIVELPQRAVNILVRPNSMQRVSSVKIKLGLVNARVTILSKWLGEYPRVIKSEIAYSIAENLYEAIKNNQYRLIGLYFRILIQSSGPSRGMPLAVSHPFLLAPLTLWKLVKLIVVRIFGKLRSHP